MDNNELKKTEVIWDKLKKVFVSNSIDSTDENFLKSIYNTEIVNPVKFNSGFYFYKPHAAIEQNMHNEYFLNKTFQDFHNNILQNGIMRKRFMDEFVLPPTTIVHFRRSKNFVKTTMLLGNGTKKEFFGFDDWEINIQILCINENNRTAQESRNLIIEWAMLLDAIPLTSNIFNRKKIFSIVIEDIDIRTIPGSPNVIPIQLRCVSTEPNEFLLNSKLEVEFFHDKKMQDFDKIIKSTDLNNFPI